MQALAYIRHTNYRHDQFCCKFRSCCPGGLAAAEGLSAFGERYASEQQRPDEKCLERVLVHPVDADSSHSFSKQQSTRSNGQH